MLVPAAVQSEQGRYLLGAVTSPRGCSLVLYSRTHVRTWTQAHAQEGIANRLLRASSQGAMLPFRHGAAPLMSSRANQGTAPRPWPAKKAIPKAPSHITAYCSPVRSRLSLTVREAAGDVASVAALRDRCPAWSHSVDPFG